MADDDKSVIDSSQISKATKASDSLTEAQKKLAKQIEERARKDKASAQAMKMDADATEDFDRRTRSANEAIKDQIKALGDQAKGLLDVSRYTGEVTGAIGDYIGELKKATSLTTHWNRLLGEIRDGQEGVSKAMMVTTANMGTASSQMQKHIDASNAARKKEADLIKRYQIDEKESQKLRELAIKNFATQRQAYSNTSRATTQLMEDTLVLSKTLGIDAAGASDYMRSRLSASNKTMKEVQNETFLVAGAIDEYIQGLQKLGNDVMKTGNIMKAQLLSALSAVQKEFKTGIIDAPAYAAGLGQIALAAKKAGKTEGEIKSLLGGVGKALSKLQDVELGSIFGIEAAQDLLAEMTQDVSKLGPQARKRFESAMDRARRQGLPEVDRLSMAIEATRGDAHMTTKVLSKLAQIEDPAVRLRFFKEAGLTTDQASLLTEQFAPGGEAYEAMQKAAQGDPEAQKKAEEWREKFKKMTEKQQTPQSKAYAAVLWIKKTMDWLKLWLSRTLWGLLIGISVAIGGSMLMGKFGGLGGALGALKGAPGALLGGLAATPGKLAGAIKGAGGIGGVLKGAGGMAMRGAGALVGGAGSLLKGGLATAGATAMISGLIDAPGVIKSSFKQAAKEGGGLKYLGAMGKTLYTATGVKAMQKMAEQIPGMSYASNKLAEGFMAMSDSSEKFKELQAMTVRQRGALTKEDLKQYEKALDLVKRQGKIRHLLTEEEKKQLDLARKIVAQQKKRVKLHKKGVKASVKATYEAQRTDVAKTAAGVTESSLAGLKGEDRARAAMEQIIRGSGRLLRYKGGEQAMEDLLSGKGKGSKELLAQLERLGVSAEQAKELAPGILAKWKRVVRKQGGAAKEAGGEFSDRESQMWERVRRSRKERGLSTTEAAIAQDIETQSGRYKPAKLTVSAEGGGAGTDMVPQEIDYNSSTGAIKIPLGQQYAVIQGKGLANAMGTEEAKDSQQNTSMGA